MKRILVIILAMLLLCSFTGCISDETQKLPSENLSSGAASQESDVVESKDDSSVTNENSYDTKEVVELYADALRIKGDEMYAVYEDMFRREVVCYFFSVDNKSIPNLIMMTGQGMGVITFTIFSIEDGKVIEGSTAIFSWYQTDSTWQIAIDDNTAYLVTDVAHGAMIEMGKHYREWPMVKAGEKIVKADEEITDDSDVLTELWANSRLPEEAKYYYAVQTNESVEVTLEEFELLRQQMFSNPDRVYSEEFTRIVSRDENGLSRDENGLFPDDTDISDLQAYLSERIKEQNIIKKD